ncbi:major facilitator superfamily domain-containing protein [Protomyces lactucae-debilis]|uniref:Major facilitator superfamily domain-containing protein n=1 Tax=Protomyces lactucae-debilis TaxID=2754530 RepID=A0A1Y2F599_PROLT|nr:major facilitator superfamily domain-containing protein [Protomyces lactucae-debilis]ORY79098.1 major facilitator superfamily domain-containing protein [Protomyces lactucae-debilis]
MLSFIGFLPAGYYAPAIPQMRAEFGVSLFRATLGIVMYPVGFTVGPLLAAPLSELYGRRIIYKVCLPLVVLSCLGMAKARSFDMFLVFRFFSSLFISGPFTVAGGTISDMWPARIRAPAVILYATGGNVAAAFGPVLGGIVCYYTTWHWIFWSQMIYVGVLFVLVWFFVPETYTPKIFAITDKSVGTARQKIITAMSRPVVMIFTEPIVAAVSAYLAFVYGLMFCSFSAYPIQFKESRGWNTRDASLPFLGIVAGIFIAVAMSPFFIRLYRKNPVPESRLYNACLGAILLPISLFWYGWTSDPSIPAIASVTAGVGIGCSLLLLFLGITDLLVEIYTPRGIAASALAANGALRTIAAAVFPLFSNQMFHKLGTNWGASLLGFIAILMLPIPFVLLRYGASIRAKSRLAQPL